MTEEDLDEMSALNLAFSELSMSSPTLDETIDFLRALRREGYMIAKISALSCQLTHSSCPTPPPAPLPSSAIDEQPDEVLF